MIDMKIDKYHITSNRFEYTVSKMKMGLSKPVKALDANGNLNIVEVTIGHYSTLAKALNGLRNYIIRTDEPRITTLDELRAVNQNSAVENSEG